MVQPLRVPGMMHAGRGKRLGARLKETLDMFDSTPLPQRLNDSCPTPPSAWTLTGVGR